MTNPLVALMPEMLEHKGIWEGTYRVIDRLGDTLDVFNSRVACIFPDQGSAVYIQRNEFTWHDGRSRSTEFHAVLDGSRLYWDTETFRGYGWVGSPNIILLELDRKDIPGASFYESIVMSPNKRQRARTWHWFDKSGACYQRTLCDEHLQADH